MDNISNVDNILMLNCLVFSGLIVLVGFRKRLLNVTIVFLAKFQLQFNDSLHLSLIVKLFCFCSIFCVYTASIYGE